MAHMFSAWKGRNKNTYAQQFLLFQNDSSSSSVGPGSPSSPSGAALGLFGAYINPGADAPPPILMKFVNFIGKASTTEHIFQPHDELEGEMQTVKRSMIKEWQQQQQQQALSSSSSDITDNVQLGAFTRNPHVVAGLMKQYLAALPEPLLTYHLYDSFLLVHTITNSSDRIWALRSLMACLPPGFRACAKLVLNLLNRISGSREVTRMDANALGTIMGPYFLRPDEELHYMKADQPSIVQIMVILIQEYESVLKTVTAIPRTGTGAGLAAAPPTVTTPTTPSRFPRAAKYSPLIDLSLKHDRVLQISDAAEGGGTAGGAIAQRLTELNAARSHPLQPTSHSLLPTSHPLLPTSHPLQPPSHPLSSTPPAPHPVQPASHPLSSTPPASNTTTFVTSSSTSSAQAATTKPSNQTAAPTSSAVSPAINIPTSQSQPIPLPSNLPSKKLPPIPTDSPAASSPSSSSSSSSFSSSLDLASATGLSHSPSPPVQLATSSKLSMSPVLGSKLSDSLDHNQKLDRLKNSVHVILDTHVSPQLIKKLRDVLQANDQQAAVASSRLLLDSKQHLVESLSTYLNISSDDVDEYIAQHPRPPSALPPPPDSSASSPLEEGSEQARLAKLHAATSSNVEQIMDVVHYLKGTVSTTQDVKQAVAIGNVVKMLKLSLEQQQNTAGGPPSAVLRAASTSQLSASTSILPPSQQEQQQQPQQRVALRSASSAELPLPSHKLLAGSAGNIPRHSQSFSGNSSSKQHSLVSPRDEVLQSADSKASEIHNKLEQIRIVALGCSQAGLMEAARGVRFIKQELTELMEQRGLTNIPEPRVESIGGEDQMTTLRRALAASTQKVDEQVETLRQHIHNSPFLDPRGVENAFNVAVRSLVVPT